MRSKNSSRVAIAIVLVVSVAVLFWYAAPTKAFEINFLSLPSGTIGSTHSFSVRVNIYDYEILPIQSIDLYIFKNSTYTSDTSPYKATATNLPLNDGGTKNYSDTDTGGGGTVSVTASTTNWASGYGYGYAAWRGYGYSFFPPGGYGYGYGGGAASITYDVTWTSPSDWPAGGYKADLKLTADSTIFTETSSEFTLSTSGVAGQVAMQARSSGPAWVTSAIVQLWDVGADRTSASPTATYNVTTGNDGSFEIAGIGPGNYDITIKGSHTLRKLAGNVEIVSGALTAVNFGTLTEGDCWGVDSGPDNVVDISDYSAILYSFGTMDGDGNWVATCDLNQDGVVDISDYSVVLNNFGLIGVAP